MKRPSTLIERFLDLGIPESVSPVSWEKSVDSLEAYLGKRFPKMFRENGEEWDYSLETASDGGPAFHERKAIPVHKLYEFSPNESVQPAWRIKITQESLVINVCAHSRDEWQWAEFKSFSEEVKQVFFNGLGLVHCGKPSVTCIFAFDSAHVGDPTLATEKWVEVKELLAPFSVMPTPEGFESYLPKYNCDQNWRCRRNGCEYLVVSQVKTAPPKVDGAPLSIFLYLTVANVENAGLQKVLPWDDWYALLKASFQCHLTEKANKLLGEDFA